MLGIMLEGGPVIPGIHSFMLDHGELKGVMKGSQRSRWGREVRIHLGLSTATLCLQKYVNTLIANMLVAEHQSQPWILTTYLSTCLIISTKYVWNKGMDNK